jgi:hypothetical protein
MIGKGRERKIFLPAETTTMTDNRYCTKVDEFYKLKFRKRKRRTFIAKKIILSLLMYFQNEIK